MKLVQIELSAHREETTPVLIPGRWRWLLILLLSSSCALLVGQSLLLLVTGHLWWWWPPLAGFFLGWNGSQLVAELRRDQLVVEAGLVGIRRRGGRRTRVSMAMEARVGALVIGGTRRRARPSSRAAIVLCVTDRDGDWLQVQACPPPLGSPFDTVDIAYTLAWALGVPLFAVVPDDGRGKRRRRRKPLTEVLADLGETLTRLPVPLPGGAA